MSGSAFAVLAKLSDWVGEWKSISPEEQDLITRFLQYLKGSVLLNIELIFRQSKAFDDQISGRIFVYFRRSSLCKHLGLVL